MITPKQMSKNMGGQMNQRLEQDQNLIGQKTQSPLTEALRQRRLNKAMKHRITEPNNPDDNPCEVENPMGMNI
jgi:hypothetical protein